jgi:DNA-binding CsgD family transcriptional regulator
MQDIPSTRRITVQDRQRLFRDGLALMLDSEPLAHAPAPVPCQVVRLDERRPLLTDRRPLLTDREVQVLGAFGGGDSTRGVANRMGISPKTVENHKQAIFAKLGVQNQSHAVAVALRRGLLNPSVGLTGSAA